MKILIADDHDIVRRGLKQLLTARGWNVCAEAKNGREAILFSEQFKPDVVILDVTMPGLNGLDAAKKIKKFLPRAEFVILTVHSSDQLVRDIIGAGARAYVIKSDAERDLVNAVEAAGNHRTYFTGQAAELVLAEYQNGYQTPVAQRNRLTARERETVQLLAEGKTSKEVGAALGISPKTAETHRANIMRKLEVHSITEVMRYAMKNHIIEP